MILSMVACSLKFNQLKNSIYYIILLSFIYLAIQSCTHEPFPPEEFDPIDQDTMEIDIDTMMIDTMMIDTTMIFNPCDSNLIYYVRDIQPLLNANCTTSGCHDVESASGGVVLVDYDSTVEQLTAFDLNNSLLYTTITENDPALVMPPSGKLENDDINKIALWILQGAENLDCDNLTLCDTTEVSYSEYVAGVMESHCNFCHNAGNNNGNIMTDTHEELKAIANSGRLIGAIDWQNNFSPMPQGQDKLDECTIDKIKSWIDAGAQDN